MRCALLQAFIHRLYSRAVSSLSCSFLETSPSSLATFCSIRLLQPRGKDRHGNLASHAEAFIHAPLVLKSCSLPLQLSFGEISGHLVDLLFKLTTSQAKGMLLMRWSTVTHKDLPSKQSPLIVKSFILPLIQISREFSCQFF